MPRQSPPQPKSRRRPGFTMIELLMVILIIGILVGLLVPAISGVIVNARNAAVLAEINTMAASIEAFKTTYGQYPPSRVVLIENGDYSTKANNSSAHFNYTDTLATVSADTTNGFAGLAASNYPATGSDINYGTLLDRSTSNLRKIWPRVALNSTTASSTATFGPYDFNGNGSPDPQPILVQGPEALVFFLGGLPSKSGVGSATGFSKNPLNPFQNDLNAGNRTVPLFEFKADRLIDDDGDLLFSYMDTLGTSTSNRPYAYFSAYGNGGYDPNDANLAGETESQGFNVNFLSGGVTSLGPNPYTSSLPTAAPTAYQKPQSFQIISPGTDRLYGHGGQFNSANSAGHLPASGIDRSDERDNLTNFNGSKLD